MTQITEQPWKLWRLEDEVYVARSPEEAIAAHNEIALEPYESCTAPYEWGPDDAPVEDGDGMTTRELFEDYISNPDVKPGLIFWYE